MKPILFNTEMVRAILDGRKTVTRRPIKPQPTHPRWNQIGWLGWDDGHGHRIHQPYHIGDILYVRETWSPVFVRPKRYIYKADSDAGMGEGMGLPIRWHPSIHMPKEAARIFLRVNDVRVERLRDISEEQAKAEGFFKGWRMTEHSSIALTAAQAFMWMWDYTIKPADRARYGWVANPYVWVIEFERIEKEEAIRNA